MCLPQMQVVFQPMWTANYPALDRDRPVRIQETPNSISVGLCAVFKGVSRRTHPPYSSSVHNRPYPRHALQMGRPPRQQRPHPGSQSQIPRDRLNPKIPTQVSSPFRRLYPRGTETKEFKGRQVKEIFLANMPSSLYFYESSIPGKFQNYIVDPGWQI
jgi:hypothetical protein